MSRCLLQWENKRQNINQPETPTPNTVVKTDAVQIKAGNEKNASLILSCVFPGRSLEECVVLQKNPHGGETSSG